MPGGRPSDYNETIAAEICSRLISGDDGRARSLRSVCRDEDMPSVATVFLWMARHPEFSAQYARACEARADADAEDIREIADTPVMGIIQKLERQQITPGDDDAPIDPDGFAESTGAPFKLVVTEEKRQDMLEHRKLQIDTRKWLMERMRPKKYSPRHLLEHSGPGGSPLSVIGGAMTPEQAAEAYAATVRGDG